MENTHYHDPSIDGLPTKINSSASDELINSAVEIKLENLMATPPKYNSDLDQFDNVARRKRYGNERSFNAFVSVNLLFNECTL